MDHDIATMKKELEGLRVLFVEDEEPLRLQTALFLRKFFPLLETAENGEEGWERFDRHPHDLVISDLRMPGMNGGELVTRVKERAPETLAIITSGLSSGDVAADVPADARLVKPVSIEAFLETMHRLLARRGSLRE